MHSPAVTRNASAPRVLKIYCLEHYAQGNGIGWPLFLALHRYHLICWWAVAVSGALAGAFAAVVSRGEFYLPYFTVLVPEGVVSGLVFWAIWRLGVAQQCAPAGDCT
jgi:hypothetical protein